MQTKTCKPDWFKIRLPPYGKFTSVRDTLKPMNLVTVCEEAKCPNIGECWAGGTATFMVMGDTCTRGCRFCAVKTARIGQELDPLEPEKLAKAIKEWQLTYVVVTSVDRDDLPDQGAEHFAKCIAEIKNQCPEIIIEVLIPDFQGRKDLLKKIVDAKPHVIGHNVETVRELQTHIRDRRANYEQSLKVLQDVKEMNEIIYRKSALMLGVGETDQQVLQTMDDLRKIDVQILTIGQYLQPSSKHVDVEEYVPLEKFDYFRKAGEEKGFLYVASGPLVRSSYKAGEFFLENVIRKDKVEIISKTSNNLN